MNSYSLTSNRTSDFNDGRSGMKQLFFSPIHFRSVVLTIFGKTK